MCSPRSVGAQSAPCKLGSADGSWILQGARRIAQKELDDAFGDIDDAFGDDAADSVFGSPVISPLRTAP